MSVAVPAAKAATAVAQAGVQRLSSNGDGEQDGYRKDGCLCRPEACCNLGSLNLIQPPSRHCTDGSGVKAKKEKTQAGEAVYVAAGIAATADGSPG